MRQCHVSQFHGRAQNDSSLRVLAEAQGVLAGVLTGRAFLAVCDC